MTAVDFTGLLVLVDALKRMEEYGGELVLSGPTSRWPASFGQPASTKSS